MPSIPDIEKQLDAIQNWILVSNKKNILRGLDKLLSKNERVLDVLDGLYRGIKISDSSDMAGVLFVTDRRLFFVTSELSSPQFEELAFDDIRGIAYERAFSSIIVTMKLKVLDRHFQDLRQRLGRVPLHRADQRRRRHSAGRARGEHAPHPGRDQRHHEDARRDRPVHGGRRRGTAEAAPPRGETAIDDGRSSPSSSARRKK